MSVMNPVRFKLTISIVCLVLQVISGEQNLRCIQREREALLQFKATLADPSGMLSSWNTDDCCQWKRIRCSNLTGHVIMLDLHGEYHSDGYYAFHRGYGFVISQRYINGQIHKSLMELQQLRYLDFSYSDFGGKIPTQLGSLSHLKYLNFSGNFLEGLIPLQLGNLSKLQHLDLSFNYFQGDIPSQFGNLSNLRHLDLGYNSIEGNLPSQFGSLSKLQYLDLSGNDFEGNIPSFLGNLSNLQHLHLVDTDFEGSIPSQLGNLSNLQKLYLGGGFSGALKIDDGNHDGDHQWLSNLISLTNLYLEFISNLNNSHSWLQMIAKLPKLRELRLYNCNLSDGFILSMRPSKFNFSTSLSVFYLSFNTFTSPMMIFPWLSNITSNLVELDLGFNHLEGSISNHFGIVMNSLEHLDLSYNRFKAEALQSFANICTLHSLNMENNTFTEDLPSILHILSSGCVRYSLRELDLASNQITGSLPDLSVFPSLKKLLLDENQLSGKIPEGIRLPSKLELLSISVNYLEGGVPKSFGNTCTLQMLDLSDNNLSEELTVIFNHLSGCSRYSLEYLGLGQNKIIGMQLPDFSMLPFLKILYLDGNKLNGTISEDLRFPTKLEQLHLNANSLKGVITDSHFANMPKLKSLMLYDNPLTLAFSQNWVPPFQLQDIELRSCKLGPAFPRWLESQNYFDSLDISNAEISDVVPEWFWAKLASLQEWSTVNISYNNLRGTIPNYPLKSVPHSFLSLASNQFEGPVPQFLQSSMSLDLYKNKFSGLQSFLCSSGLAEIVYWLDLSDNKFSGQIPDCWSHFKSLVYLNMSHNTFSGKIPTSMGSLLELQVLLLRNNDLTGEIPLSLRNCPMLVMVDMAENKLLGSIPDWIGSELQKLQILSLGGNHFYGSLPLQICYLKNIQVLDLSLNNLSGQMPKCINNFTSMAQKTSTSNYRHHSYAFDIIHESGTESYDLNALLMWKGSKQMFMDNGLSLLKSIDLSSNHFSEEIPREIENLFELVSLNLSRNKLTGEIPSNIGRLTSLEFLDLSRNQLLGWIPPSLTQIDRLSMLDLSHNNLSGKIPISTQLQSFNASCYEDNLDLCGLPLPKLCIDGEPTQESIVKHHEDEYLLFTREFYMSMAIGFVISFWGVFGSILINRSWRHAYFRFISNLYDAIYVTAAVKVFKWRHR